MNLKHKTLPACGNRRCCVSTGIHDGFTFGRGELDTNGYWQFPCRICARAYDEDNPDSEYGPAWPFAETQKELRVSEEDLIPLHPADVDLLRDIEQELIRVHGDQALLYDVRWRLDHAGGAKLAKNEADKTTQTKECQCNTVKNTKVVTEQDD